MVLYKEGHNSKKYILSQLELDQLLANRWVYLLKVHRNSKDHTEMRAERGFKEPVSSTRSTYHEYRVKIGSNIVGEHRSGCCLG